MGLAAFNRMRRERAKKQAEAVTTPPAPVAAEKKPSKPTEKKNKPEDK